MTQHADSALAAVLVAETSVLVLFFAALVGHGAWRSWNRRWTDARLIRGRALVADALDGVREDDAVRWLEAQPMGLRLELCVEFASAVSGQARDRLQALALQVGLISRAEAFCRSRRWTRRLRGARTLTMLHDIGQSSDTLYLLLHDSHSAVRAQAIEWAAARATPDLVTILVERLADPSPLSRYISQDALRHAGMAAVEPVIRYLQTHRGAGLLAALAAAKGLALPALLPTVLALMSDPSAAVRARATAILGVLGGEEGVQALLHRLTDPEPEVRASAAHAVGELGHWPAAPVLADLLRDRAFPVRREAALALRRLGAPGMLLLRRALTDANGFASDMARQVLDLPDVVYRNMAS